MMYLWICLVGAALYLSYKWLSSNSKYFEERHVPYLKPLFLLGETWKMVTKKMSIIDSIVKNYNMFPNASIFGTFELRTPFYVFKDPELIKRITVKDFDYFMDHRTLLTPESDPLFANALVLLTGQKWKDMRATLSPAFTGSKMRNMFYLIRDCTNDSIATIKSQLKGKDDMFEMKEFFNKFTVDTIATCAFGIEVNSFKNPDNDFQKVATEITNNTGFVQMMKIFGIMLFPKLMTTFKVSFLSQSITTFFRKAVHDTMTFREKQGIVRPDMINLLLQAKRGKLQHQVEPEDKTIDGFSTVQESTVGQSKVTRKWTDDELCAQCLIFFLAGFDTTSNTISIASYELAVNEDVQRRVRNEIMEVEGAKTGEFVTYDDIQKMKYLDQVVSEVLRKWPPAPAIERIAVKDYKLDVDDLALTLEKGRNVLIPIYGLHHDEKHFPNPQRFDPERFSEANKGVNNMNAYMPFGIGPRNCIASRFALMEVKTVLYYMILNFQFKVCEKTQIPIKYEKSMVSIKMEKGTWIELREIKQ